MINLLPPEIKQGYGYARRNVVLRRWVVIIMVSIVGLGAIMTYGLLTFQQSSQQYDKKITKANETLKAEKFTATQQQVKDINSSFKLVVKVLSQEVLFSQLLKQIAVTVPANSNLTGLNISQTQTAIDISANATDYNTATQVQVNLSDPNNKIFSKADIVSINCGGSTNTAYPCTVTIKALLASDNPFLFISNKGVKR
jgi:hypothetical protein